MTISYMGTKRHIAGDVRRLANGCRTGALLDLFSGMCTVGRSVAADRQIWSNDLQIFAHEVAFAQFCSRIEKVNVDRVAAQVGPLINENIRLCELLFAHELAEEKRAIARSDSSLADSLFLSSVERAQSLGTTYTCSPTHTLLVSRFGGSYFGTGQAVEADSIRYALDRLRESGTMNQDEFRWCLLALCMVLSRISTTTGHFAQPLRPKKANEKRFFSQRSRSVTNEWLQILPELKASGRVKWRTLNKTFKRDAIDLLDDLRLSVDRPAVVYADPPYTKDQYSRYYHLLETVILYDFPSCEGTGLYRADRAVSVFSQKTKVEEAIDALIIGCRRLRADFILSYPEDGLLAGSKKIIPRMIKEHYGNVPDILEIDHLHSTMGASKGKGKHFVKEIIYRVVL